jgi:hypothetical protein
MNNEKLSNEALNPPLRKGDVTSRSFCECKKIESARLSGLGEYICGTCNKKLDEVQSNEFARCRASYYGW